MQPVSAPGGAEHRRAIVAMAVNPKPGGNRLDSHSKAVKRKRDQENPVAAKVHKKAKSDAAPVSGQKGRS